MATNVNKDVEQPYIAQRMQFKSFFACIKSLKQCVSLYPTWSIAPGLQLGLANFQKKPKTAKLLN
jgi:hypothetical protein